MSMMHNVFISYSHHDKAFAKRLADDLRRHGISVWIDHSGIKPGTPNWETAIRDAISSVQAIVYVASPIARQSPYVRDELDLAKQHQHPIYPILIAGANQLDAVPLGYNVIQHIDARVDYDLALHKLVEALRYLPPSLPQPPSPPSSQVSPPVHYSLPVRTGSHPTGCIITATVSVVLVTVLLFMVMTPIFNFVSHVFNSIHSALSTSSSSSASPNPGELVVTPSSFNITRAEGTRDDCSYFSGRGWDCGITLRNKSQQGNIAWRATPLPDSITIDPSTAFAPLTPGETDSTPHIHILDSFCGHGDISFKGAANSVDVTIDCT